MSKVRIYIPNEELSVNLKIEEREILHKIKDVLTLKESEKVYVFDGAGKEYVYEIGDVNRNHVLLINKQISRQDDEIKNKIILAIPLLKEQKIEYILEKATELGVESFQPFICERSIREMPSSEKMKRWARIVQEATRQSERLWIPKIEEILAFDNLMKKDFKTKICAAIDGAYIKDMKNYNKEKVLLIAGPEGDFSPQEFIKMKDNNFYFLKLSENILRAETASVFMVGLANYLMI
ncbi:MAG: RsmE family RNA methyltransferase [Candidatus Omnitrophota bacterium]|jgi:16S rRNA (uracil1498-N3)-methyltransferase